MASERTCSVEDCSRLCYGRKDICKTHYQQIWRAVNPEKVEIYNQRHRDYLLQNQDEIKKKEKLWRERNRDRRKIYKREWQIKQYGLTKKMIASMQQTQDNGCAICRQKTDLVIDHDHQTKTVRGLLCNTCNIGLGHFYDNPLLLENAIRYLGVKDE